MPAADRPTATGQPPGAARTPSRHLRVTAIDGIGEVTAGADLAGLLLRHTAVAHADPADGDLADGDLADGDLADEDLADGDIVVVTSKVVSKAEGRVRGGDPAASLAEETVRTLARQGSLAIVRSRLGITHARAGIDESNVAMDYHALLPLDPDASAATIRAAVWQRTGINLGVLISDTAGRAWRLGQTEIAIGASGVRLIEEYLGRRDHVGRLLQATEPCVGDELCSAAELAQTKTGRRPFAVIRGRPDLVTAPSDPGDRASSLNRPIPEDLFGFGAREAVIRAIAGRPADADGFGAPASARELVKVLNEVIGG
ncbi:MAG: coenzyme F420-0:L-glutamate ligase, partial [Nocardioides sp.]